MAGPVPTYIATQQATQTAFTVPFGLLAFVNAAISAAIAAGEFNTTVDCSLFVTEDVSNLRIYLDSLGYTVDFAKNTNEKSLNIDWGRFRDTPGTAVTVFQGTTPWIVSGTITTSPDVNVHDGSGNTISSTGTSLNVNVTDFPATVAVTQSTSPWVVSGTVAATQSGVWSTGRTWVLASGTDSVAAVQSGVWTVQQGTPPWSVSVTNFPATQPVSGTVTALQGTSPWVVAGTVTANAGTGDFTVVQPTGANLHVVIDNFPAVQPVSGTVTALQGTSPWVTSVSNFPAVQPVSGTVTALQGTSPWVVSGSITTSPNVNIHDSTGNALSSTGTSLDVNVTNFPATQNVSVVTALPAGTNVIGHVITDSGSTTVVTGNVTVVQPTGTNLHAVIDNFPADADAYAQGSTTSGQLGDLPLGAATTTAPTYVTGTSNPLSLTLAGALRTDSSATTQPISGTVTANQGTSPWVISGTVAATQSGAWTTGRTWALSSGTDSVAAVQSGAWSTGRTWTLSSGTDSVAVTGTVTANQGTSPWVVSLASTTITGTVAVTQSTSPWVVSGTVTTAPPANASTNLTQVAGVTLGATAVTAYGTAPAAANVPGVNAFITNTPAVTLASTTITGNVTVVQPTGANLNVAVSNFPADTDAYAQGSTTSGQLGNLTMGAVTTAAPAYTTAQTNPLSLTTAGALRVDGSAVTQPVSLTSTTITGTVTVAGAKTNNNAAPGATNVGTLPALANAASPSWTEGNQVAESVDLTGRQRVRGTLTNNNAAPAADQLSVIPALANAAAPIWVEGDQVLLSETLAGQLRTTGGGVAQASTTAGELGPLVQGAVTTAAPVYTTAQTSPLSLDTAGNLRVTVVGSGGGLETVVGNKTNNNTAPGATNVGVLPALANAATPTWTEGNQVLESVDLSGRQRILDAQVATAAVTRVSVGSGATVTLLASRAARIRVIIYNEAGQLYIKAGSTATTTDYTWNIGANTVLEIEGYYTGILTAIKGASTTNVQVTDF